MEYVIKEMQLLKEWVGIAKDELTQIGYSINNMADDKIGILYFTYLKRTVAKKPRQIFKSSNFNCPSELLSGLCLLKEKLGTERI